MTERLKDNDDDNRPDRSARNKCSLAGQSTQVLDDNSKASLLENEALYMQELQAMRQRPAPQPYQTWTGHKLTHMLSLLSRTGNKNDQKRAVTQAVRDLLHSGIDLDSVNEMGETLFYAAVKHKAPVQMILVIGRKTKNVNKPDNMGQTVLCHVLSTQCSVDPQFLTILLELGCDLEVRNQSTGKCDCPDALKLLLERHTDVKELLDVVKQCQPDVISRNKISMLKYAASDGSALALEAVLKLFPQTKSRNTPYNFALLAAAGSSRETIKKVQIMLTHNVNVEVRDQRQATLMHVAASNQSLEMLQIAHELGLDPNATDQSGNTPLHYCSYVLSPTNSSCIDMLIQFGAKVNLLNKHHETPLLISLKINDKSNIISLVRSGAVLPSSKKLHQLGIDASHLSTLCSTDVIFESPDPIVTAMTLSGIFCNLARFNPMKAVLYYNFRDEMEDIAVTMLDAATNHTQQPLIITDKLLATALDKNQKKVIGHTKMQDYLALQWCGSRSFSFQTLLYAIWLISVYCIKLTLAPFVIPIAAVLYGRDFRKLVWRRLFVCTPSIARYATTTLVYLAFVSVIMYDSVSTAGLRDPRHFLVSDYVMTVFLAGFLLNGVCKLTSSGPATYFCKVKNLMDISVIVLFAINYTIRFHNKIVYHDTDLRDTIDSISLSHRVASLAYALGSLLAVLRVLGYLQIIYSIGPILTSFRKITAATTSFIFILLVFLIAFAVALTNVYAANSYSLSLDIVHDCLHQSNTTKPFIQNALSPPAAITGCIQYAMELADPPLRPAVAADVIKSAVNLVWATFGLIETDDYKSYNKIETTIGQFLLAMWLVSAIIILTNMLVAMITNIFDKVQDNADLEWKFTQAEVIWETVTVPSVQPPFNIPYYVAMTLGYLITLCPLCHCTRKIHNIESEVSDDPLASSINSNLSLWEAYQSEIKKRKQSEPVTKKKLERLQDKLIQEIQSIKRESRAAYSRNTTSSDSGCSTDQLDSDVFTLSTGQDISHTVEHMQMYLEKLSEDINKVKMQLLMTEIRKTPVPV